MNWGVVSKIETTEKFLKDTTTATDWIYETIKKICTKESMDE